MVTGFSGIAMGRSEYLFSGRQVLVQPRELNSGAIVAGQWFDESRLVSQPNEEAFPPPAGFRS
jgi:hypothetical protein